MPLEAIPSSIDEWADAAGATSRPRAEDVDPQLDIHSRVELATLAAEGRLDGR